MAFLYERLATKFLFYKEKRELEVQELLNEARKSPDDYIRIIERVERELKKSRDDKTFMQSIQKVIAGLRALVWPNKTENTSLLQTQVDPRALEETLMLLKNNSFRIEPVLSETSEKKQSS